MGRKLIITEEERKIIQRLHKIKKNILEQDETGTNTETIDMNQIIKTSDLTPEQISAIMPDGLKKQYEELIKSVDSNTTETQPEQQKTSETQPEQSKTSETQSTVSNKKEYKYPGDTAYTYYVSPENDWIAKNNKSGKEFSLTGKDYQAKFDVSIDNLDKKFPDARPAGSPKKK